jgi:hypothetical protein
VTFRLGLFAGMLSVLCSSLVCLGSYHRKFQNFENLKNFILVILLRKDNALPFNWKIAIRQYRGLLLIVTHIFFIGLNTYGWSSSGVNHVLIFEIDPRNHLVYQELLEVKSY